jgi:hypothetical protein
MPVKYYRDQDDELWLLVTEFCNEGKEEPMYKQKFWFSGFEFILLSHEDKLRLRQIQKTDLNYLELHNVEEWLAEEEYWRTWDELRRTSMVFGKTWLVLEQISREARGLWS